MAVPMNVALLSSLDSSSLLTHANVHCLSVAFVKEKSPRKKYVCLLITETIIKITTEKCERKIER